MIFFTKYLFYFHLLRIKRHQNSVAPCQGGEYFSPLGFTQSDQFWPNWWKFQGNLYISSTFRIHWQFAPPYRAFLSYTLCTKPGLIRGISRKSAIKLFFYKTRWNYSTRLHFKCKTKVVNFLANFLSKISWFLQICKICQFQ